jgi:hypothetical protein
MPDQGLVSAKFSVWAVKSTAYFNTLFSRRVLNFIVPMLWHSPELLLNRHLPW